MSVSDCISQLYEDCLRRVTQEGLNRGTFTVNKARAAAEEELGLDEGFFKNDAAWKAKSKEVIQIAVEDPTTKPQPVPALNAGTKRKSRDAPIQEKQPRKSIDDSELSELDLDDSEESEAQATPSDDDDFSDAKPVKPAKKVPAKRKPTQKKSKALSDDDESDAKPEKKAPVKRKATKKRAEKVVEDSEASDLDEKELSLALVLESTEKSEYDVKAEGRDVKEESALSDPPTDDKPDTNGKALAPEVDGSDMSVLIDEPPKKKRSKKAVAEPKKVKTAKAKLAGKDLSPDEQEIKRLQGWLMKCGIRRKWHNELKQYDSPKPKIKHLKKILEDAGMSGRYSNEKAKDIRERRELAEELKAAQEYAKKWGQDKDAGNCDGGGHGEQVSEEELKPATRKPKGLVDFGDSGDDGSD